MGEPVQVSAARPGAVHVEPFIAASPADPTRLVAAVMVVDSPHSERWHDSQRMVVYASRDGGRSWSPRPVPGLPASWMSGDPWLAWGSDGVLWLSCVASESMLDGAPVHTRVFRSEDGGWAWTGPLEPFPAGTAQDHPVLATGSGPGGEFRLVAFGSSADGDDGIDVAVLDPEAGAFRPLPTHRPDTQIVNLGSGVVLPGGRPAFTWFRMGAQPWDFRAVAEDGGDWAETVIRESILPVGFPMLAVDAPHGEHRGRLFAVWVEGAVPMDQADPRVRLAHSDDGGRSWSDPVTVHRHAEPANRTLPAVAVNRAGVVGVVWLDYRHRPDRSDCPAVYFAASTDGGATFGEERQVDEPACFGTDANGVAVRRWSLGGGDYMGITAAADGAFHVIWPGSRTGVLQAWTAVIRVTGPRAPGTTPPPPRR